jgi:hypothetical protein
LQGLQLHSRVLNSYSKIYTNKSTHQSIIIGEIKPMKHILIILFIFALLIAPAQVKAQDDAPSHRGALLFTVNSNNFGVSSYNEGIGLKWYLANSLALRGSVAGTFATHDGNSTTNGAISAGILTSLFTTKQTTVYVGVEGVLIHTEPEVSNIYGIGGVIGGEFLPWENVGLGAEYKVDVTRDSKNDVTTIALGRSIANFILNLYF